MVLCYINEYFKVVEEKGGLIPHKTEYISSNLKKLKTKNTELLMVISCVRFYKMGNPTVLQNCNVIKKSRF